MGGSSPQTTTVNNQAPSWALPYLKQIVGEAGKNYDAGVGAQVYGGPNLAPLSSDTRTGQAALRGVADRGGALPYATAPMGALQSIAGSDVGTGTANAALNKWLNVSPNTTAPQWADMYRNAGTMNDQNLGILNRVAQNPITTEGLYGSIYRDAGTQNRAPSQGISNIGSGRNDIGTAGGYDALGRFAASQNDDWQGVLRNASAQAGGPTAAGKYLTGIAAGGPGTGADDPYIRAIADDNAQRIRNQLAGVASGRGQLGMSGVNDAIARQISNANNPLFAGAAEAARNRQLLATGQIDAATLANRQQQIGAATAGAGINQGDLAQQLQALAGRTGVEGQNIANQLNAWGLLGNLNLQGNAQQLAAAQGLTGAEGMEAGLRTDAASRAAGINQGDLAARSGILGQLGNTQMANAGFQTGVANQAASNARADTATQMGAAAQALNYLPQMQALMERPGQIYGAIGSQMDQRAQYDLQQKIAQWQAGQNVPWTQLEKLLGPVMAATGGRGQTQTTTPPPQFGAQQIAGLGIAGLPALFASNAGGTSAAAGLGAAFSSILPYLAALPALSDRNEKTDIKRLGTSETTGLPIYAYRYRGDPRTYPKVIGPMADEIEEKYPGSTGILDGKMYVKPHAVGLLGAF